MTSKEFSGLSGAELQNRLDESYKEIFNLRFQRAQGQMKDTNSMRRVRLNIARIMTIQRQRELAAQSPTAQSPTAETQTTPSA